MSRFKLAPSDIAKILGKILRRGKEIKPKGPTNASNEDSFDERDE